MKAFLFPILLLLFSCNSQPARLDSYYFPVNDYFTAKTDCFVNQNDTADKIYWEMRAYISGNDTFMQTKVSDKNGVTDDIIERISNGVVTIRSYTLYDYDQNQMHVECKSRIIDSITFNGNQGKNEYCSFRLKYFHPYTHDSCELSRRRQLKNVEENQITFSDQLAVEFDNSNKGYAYKSTMIYEKGKGLVAYKMQLPNGEARNYKLVKGH